MNPTSTAARPAEPGCSTRCHCWPRWPTSWSCAPSATPTWPGRDRVHGIGRSGHRRDRPVAGDVLHRGIAGAVYGGPRRRPAGRSRAAWTRWPPRAPGRGWRRDPRGRFLSSRGQRPDRRPARARAAAAGDPDGGARRRARRARSTATALAAAYPDADRPGRRAPARPLRGRVVLGPAPRRAAARRTPRRWPPTGWTPVLLRANTGLSLRANGVALTALLRAPGRGLAGRGDRVALVGHSMGGLVIRAAAAVATPGGGAVDRGWSPTSSPSARRTSARRSPAGSVTGAGRSARLPEVCGVRPDPRPALGRRPRPRRRASTEDVPPLPHARYRLVSATLQRARPRHPVGAFLGDLLVRQPSAYGRGRRGATCSPAPRCCTCRGADHFDLLNHPVVHAALRRWLAWTGRLTRLRGPNPLWANSGAYRRGSVRPSG